MTSLTPTIECGYDRQQAHRETEERQQARTERRSWANRIKVGVTLAGVLAGGWVISPHVLPTEATLQEALNKRGSIQTSLYTVQQEKNALEKALGKIPYQPAAIKEELAAVFPQRAIDEQKLQTAGKIITAYEQEINTINENPAVQDHDKKHKWYRTAFDVYCGLGIMALGAIIGLGTALCYEHHAKGKAR
ncbi:MAG: hypothetical protein Q7R96_04745 [Nanoarchaeota archaeon]|nr:hypothetical protein [Nanoarchaeota archaeon]